MWKKKPRPDALSNSFITGVDQVCTVVREFDATIATLTNKLGIGPFKCWDVKPPALFNRTFRGNPAEWTMRLGVALVGGMQWEVIQPATGPSLYAEHLERHGEGLHHILLETAGTSHEESVARFEAQSFPSAQTAMLNIPLQVGPITVPAAPQILAAPMSTHFGYVDTHDVLGTTMELARFPPGVSRPLGIRIGKADFFAPPDATNVTASLPNSFIDHVEKLGFIVRDAKATIEAWADRCGVGPWHIVHIGPESIGNVTVGAAPADFRAKVGWAMMGSTLLEVIQPIAGDTPHAHLLAEKGDGLHYLGVRSDTVSTVDATRHLASLGCPTLLEGVLFGGYDFSLVDASSVACTWLELMTLGAEVLFQQLCRLQPAERYPAA